MESGSHFDSSRAELFEALGHPTRVKILRTLEGRPMGFAELKREVGIESSGHLQFHLGKLTGLVTTNAEGSYTLTDDGREAIRVLKAIPANSEQIPLVSTAPKRRANWLIPILAIFMIATVVLAGVTIYQQEQIATTNRNMSAVTVSIGGTSYYYETFPLLSNGSTLQFHGVIFTILSVPSPDQTYSNPSNFTYAGSVRLTNGTLLNLAGKTVTEEMNLICKVTQTTSGNSTGVHYASCDPGVGVSITFPDGSQVVHPGFNLTARHQNAYDLIATPVYVLTYTILPSTSSPWFTQHDGLTAGFFCNATAEYATFGAFALTLYVSVPS